jgi:parallel beta-helix repeat protein
MSRTNLPITWLLVPLLLSACAVPAPVATPTPPPIHLEANGSGDYPTLEEAIKTAPVGATIVLGPGTYHLAEPIVANQAVRLVGAGMDQTEIVSGAGGYVLLFSGEGPFTAEDITFRHEGSAEATVVIVEGGEIAFSHCRFTGGTHAGGSAGGAGLLLQGTTSGIVQESEAVGNDHTGILVRDQAQPTLVGNVCSDNGAVGITFIDTSGGIARRNECTANDLGGILVAGEAEPTLEENVCNGNGDSGIAYFDGSGGTAVRNDCSRNGRHGILVVSTANPELVDNECHGNATTDVQDER